MQYCTTTSSPALSVRQGLLQHRALVGLHEWLCRGRWEGGGREGREGGEKVEGGTERRGRDGEEKEGWRREGGREGGRDHGKLRYSNPA